MQREGLLGAACDNTGAGHNSFAALALGVLVDSCGGGAYLGRSVSYEEMLKGVWNENIRYQAAEIPVEIYRAHKQTVIPRGSGA